ncbi:MAG: hypothetical protein ACOWWO_13650 [Peptococcaceae bacterium]
MDIILLVLLFGGICIFEIPGLVYRKYWKELLSFLLLLGLAFIMSTLSVLDITIPSPAKGIEIAVTFFFDMFKHLTGS